jgi:phosphonopyruvate decarboxylase
VALACGYRQAARCDGLAGFDAALGEALSAARPAFVHMRIAPDLELAAKLLLRRAGLVL